MTATVTTIPARKIDPDDLPGIGSQMTHAMFGTGTVVGHGHVQVGTGPGSPLVEIDFGGTVGIKKFLTRYAPLSKVNEMGKVAYADQVRFDEEVGKELWNLNVRNAARELHRIQNEPDAPPFDAGTLEHFLSLPDEDAAARIEGLIPGDASTLLVAQRKTGKTTLCLNYARALITGEDFLGTFGVRPVSGTVSLLNYEVSRSMITRWADEAQIPRERLYIVNLRGRRNPLGHPDDRAALVEKLREVGTETLIVDPFGRAFTGKSQNDPAEVGSWLVDLDLFARGEVGARDLLLTAHAGWNGERTRGSSALEDWADAIVYMTRADDDEEQRFLRAIGRDVELDEDRLEIGPNRTLTLAGVGSRKKVQGEKKRAELAVLVHRAAYIEPGINVAGLVKALREMPDAPPFRDGDVSHAARYAEQQGMLRIEGAGPGKPIRHYALTPEKS